MYCSIFITCFPWHSRFLRTALQTGFRILAHLQIGKVLNADHICPQGQHTVSTGGSGFMSLSPLRDALPRAHSSMALRYLVSAVEARPTRGAPVGPGGSICWCRKLSRSLGSHYSNVAKRGLWHGTWEDRQTRILTVQLEPDVRCPYSTGLGVCLKPLYL